MNTLFVWSFFFSKIYNTNNVASLFPGILLSPTFSFEMFARQKIIRIGLNYLRFLHPWQEFWEVFWQLKATVQANAKIQNGDCQIHPLHLAAQITVYDMHTEFTEIGGLLFNMCL